MTDTPDGDADKPPPLTAEQADLVARHEGMCRAIARQVGWGLGPEDLEDLAAEFRLQVVVAARTFDPARGFTFSTYYMKAARQRTVRRARLLRARGLSVPRDGPFDPVTMVSTDERWEYGQGGSNSRRSKQELRNEVADYRRPIADDAASPLLRAWCDPEYAAQRANLSWTRRLVLYLRLVEGLSLEAVGECFGVSKERVRQVQIAAGQALERSRRLSAARMKPQPPKR